MQFTRGVKTYFLEKKKEKYFQNVVLLKFLPKALSIMLFQYYAPVICIHCPIPTVSSGDKDFPSITTLNTLHCRDNWVV